MHLLIFLGILAAWGGASAYESATSSKKNSQNTPNYTDNLINNTVGKSQSEVRKWLRRNR